MSLSDWHADVPPPRRQSGVIPYRWKDGALEVLLVTRRRGDGWIVPKGNVEPDLFDHESAAKEAREEAGVVGRVAEEPAGSFHYARRGVAFEVAVFDLEVEAELDNWPERHERQRRWARVAEAAQVVASPELRQLILSLGQRLAARRTGPGP
jgi:8-oxo-dGTP pyrophosphatase MutT (NUDIX family)